MTAVEDAGKAAMWQWLEELELQLFQARHRKTEGKVTTCEEMDLNWWMKRQEMRFEKLEKLVDALCTVRVGRGGDEGYSKAWDIVVKHSRIPQLKAELARLEGK